MREPSYPSSGGPYLAVDHIAVEFPLISGLGTFRPTSELGIRVPDATAEVPFRAPAATDHCHFPYSPALRGAWAITASAGLITQVLVCDPVQ